jgi:hypothetical protein
MDTICLSINQQRGLEAGSENQQHEDLKLKQASIVHLLMWQILLLALAVLSTAIVIFGRGSFLFND